MTTTIEVDLHELLRVVGLLQRDIYRKDKALNKKNLLIRRLKRELKVQNDLYNISVERNSRILNKYNIPLSACLDSLIKEDDK